MDETFVKKMYSLVEFNSVIWTNLRCSFDATQHRSVFDTVIGHWKVWYLAGVAVTLLWIDTGWMDKKLRI